MRRVILDDAADLAQWREAARGLLLAAVPPAEVLWEGGAQGDLLGGMTSPTIDADVLATSGPAGAGAFPARAAVSRAPRVPREFLALATLVIAHANPQRHARLYRLLWRLVHGERELLAMATDPDVAWAHDAAKAVSREKHKMKAFVRFREVADARGAVYIAWFEPEHDVLPQVAPFFVRRFAGMRWSILTPARSAHWDGEALHLGEGAHRGDAPDGDALEDLWRVYYANIFNPARLKVDAMVKEMPRRYWKNMPETSLIPALVRDAGARMQQMVDAAPTVPRKAFPAPDLPSRALPAAGLDGVHQAVSACRACALWRPATQAVPGEGPADARVMVIGEQPGDQEDLAGRPFVGPAGQLFARALHEVGIDRGTLYVTNTVKHFKYAPRGKHRLHVRADAGEQAACRPWLEAELAQLRPRFVLCLGAMAAQALLGAGFAVLRERGRWHPLADGTAVLATVHPSYLLRLPAAEQPAAREAFLADLRMLRNALSR
ncbi:UdgX family uracil-DNA binding protein [Luteimonas sp. MC1782]|uniref:UdgX family uracil-DNA binding protein n=1 Tax=Luteimonas sp. MC1782 TaxID=2760305 RepID=UPI00160337ED|nr:UdgX family uracil-DNA binding protein [Luteimonas sp. MC1782]MBB1471700.1 UdgX family uracil-DNA binding protein [Luteimonas sp. MC1782]